MSLHHLVFVGLIIASAATRGLAAASAQPITSADLVFEEHGGLVAVEAEHFFRQELTDKRAWHLFHAGQRPVIEPDTDGTHVRGASGGAYLELLPDTRWTHGEKLITGENFSNAPGKMAVLSYKVHFNTPGRYHFWARAYSTGSEDNGLHVGLDGTWPESGQRWQTVQKNGWHWDSRQRTQEVHAGVPGQLFLDIPTAGEHLIQIAMREDGFELDKWLMTTDRNYTPEGTGLAPRVKSGRLPPPFAVPANYVEAPAPTTPAPPTAAKAKARAAPAPAQARIAAAQKAGRTTIARQPHGNGAVKVSGELKQWHKVTVDLAGPFAAETDTAPNPFTDYRCQVTFTHESGSPVYSVPGYFAADGNAANTSATAGTVWRAHLSPDKTGRWTYRIAFTSGPYAALDGGGAPLAPFDGKSGTFTVARTDKRGRDFRAEGRLTYNGTRYLHFAGSGRPFLKAGADAPETLLAYADFDDTITMKPNVPVKTWSPHVRDWRPSDPTWKDGKGKGLIGALNYLSGKGANAFSFLPYNAGGDGDNVWPFITRDEKLHYDCSKLDQWGIVFDHATKLGLYLHFKLQETENDDNRLGSQRKEAVVPESLDGGKLGPERKLYCRELIARFSHNLALNWNIGEENTQTTEEINDMINYLRLLDPYQHHVVIHTHPGHQDEVYDPLLGDRSKLTGISLQNSNVKDTHWQVVKWVKKSTGTGRPWVVAFDEPGDAGFGMPPDDDWPGMKELRASGRAAKAPTVDETRKYVLWGALMAGGAGVEYYFGYQLPENDLLCEDWRSRDRSWDYCRIALEFFSREKIPVTRMESANVLVGNPKNDNSRYCFAQPGQLYLVYLPDGGACELDLGAAAGATFSVAWFNPRSGGPLQRAADVRGGASVGLTAPSAEDWLAVVRRK
jgi:hypothetical protein